MAAPIIDGTDPASPLVFAPGETKAVRVLAHDPDSGPPVSQSFTVSDSQGNTTPLTVTVQVEDDLSYSADAPPSGWAVVQDAGDEAVFHITAPF